MERFTLYGLENLIKKVIKMNIQLTLFLVGERVNSPLMIGNEVRMSKITMAIQHFLKVQVRGQ